MDTQPQLSLPIIIPNKPPQFIGIYSCAPRMGKSTIADHLVDKHCYTRVKFAAPLHAMTETLLTEMGVSEEDLPACLEGPRKGQFVPGYEYKGLTPRYILQTLGTEWGRDCVAENFWVDIALFKATKLLAEGKSVVIDDMRFPNEYEAIKRQSGQVFRVHRPSEYLWANDAKGHSSEGGLNDRIFDEMLFNDRTIQDLLDQVDKLYV